MSSFPIACQTITWGENQCERFPEVFAEIAAGGFDGVEIGFRHIRAIPPADLREMLGQSNLALAASHVGGNLENTDQASGERKILDEVLAYLEAMGTQNLMYSGLRFADEAQFASDLEMLNRSAAECARRGVRLLYHNHDWEFADGGRVINALLESASDQIGFCPDVGWVMKGGGNAVEFLQAAKCRIGAVHFKDFATRGQGCDTVLLGDGVAPLAEAAEWVKANVEGLWMIAEQDIADVPTAQVAESNGAFLKQALGVGRSQV